MFGAFMLVECWRFWSNGWIARPYAVGLAAACVFPQRSNRTDDTSRTVR
jgi:hypothetical protein